MKLSEKFISAAFGVGAIVIPAILIAAPGITALAEGRTTLGDSLVFPQVLACFTGAVIAVALGAYSSKKSLFAAAALVTATAIGYGAYDGTLDPRQIAQRFGAPATPGVR